MEQKSKNRLNMNFAQSGGCDIKELCNTNVFNYGVWQVKYTRITKFCKFDFG